MGDWADTVQEQEEKRFECECKIHSLKRLGHELAEQSNLGERGGGENGRDSKAGSRDV